MRPQKQNCKFCPICPARSEHWSSPPKLPTLVLACGHIISGQGARLLGCSEDLFRTECVGGEGWRIVVPIT